MDGFMSNSFITACYSVSFMFYLPKNISKISKYFVLNMQKFGPFFQRKGSYRKQRVNIIILRIT